MRSFASGRKMSPYCRDERNHSLYLSFVRSLFLELMRSRPARSVNFINESLRPSVSGARRLRWRASAGHSIRRRVMSAGAIRTGPLRFDADHLFRPRSFETLCSSRKARARRNVDDQISSRRRVNRPECLGEAVQR